MAFNRTFTCGEIADWLDAKVEGDKNLKINKLNRIDSAKSGELTFFSDEKFLDEFLASKATCIIVPEKIDRKPKDNQTFLKVESPYDSFIKLIKIIDSKHSKPSSFIHSSAIVGENCDIHPTAYIGPYCVIGDNCSIGENTLLNAGVKLCGNASIGSNTVLHYNAIICEDVVIGNNCIIQPGAVIGSDGFGYTENKDGSYEKIPQIGNVVIEDDVEIGANTTIDRAIVGSTVIEKGTKIDNLVQVAHNVTIGENTGIAAQVGISGSTKVGKRNRLAGQVGISGHIHTSDDVTVLAQSGLAKPISEKGYYFGSPAREKRLAMSIEAVLNHLPEMYKDVHKLKKELKSKK